MHDVCLAKLPVIFCVDRAGVVGADGCTHQGVFDIAMLRCLPGLTICAPRDAEDFRSLFREALDRNGPTVIRYPRGSASWFAKAQAVAAAFPGSVAVQARYLKPFDRTALESARAEGRRIVTIENGSLAGGFGEAIGADIRFGWPDEFIPHGSQAELEKRYGLDADSIITRLSTFNLQPSTSFLIYG